MLQTDIVKSVREYIKNLNASGFSVKFVVVYGSQVTGKATEYSDIDLIVVSSDFDNLIEHKILDELWQIAGRTDHRIEPIPCGLERWEKDDYTPIIDIARNEGTIVTLN
jgi:predicted nucleotidyltransferase